MWWLALALAGDGAGRVRELRPHVSELRGLSWVSDVPVMTLTPDEVRARLAVQSRSESSDQHLAEEAMALDAFGLIPAGYDLRDGVVGFLGEQGAGFYDTDERTLFLVDRPLAIEAGTASEDMVIAHELVHALQDQRFDLGNILNRRYESDDVSAAVRMLVEGDATYAMYLDQFRIAGQDLDQLPLLSLFERMGQPVDEGEPMVGDAMSSTPAILRDLMIAPYIHGPVFVQALRDRGWERVDRAFDALPLSTEQILHPDKYLSGDWPRHIGFPKSKRIGRGWRPLRENSFGELGMRAFLRHHYPDRNLRAVAAGWDGDRYRIWATPDGHTAFVWYSVWDGEDDALQWETVAADWVASNGGTVERRGDAVLVTRNLPEATRDAALSDVWTSTSATEMADWRAFRGRADGRF
jgi:hypothetical protein